MNYSPLSVTLIALVVFSALIARSQILADVLTLNSGEKVDGRITAESEILKPLRSRPPRQQVSRKE